MDFQSRSKSSDADYGCANIQRANSPTLVNFGQSRQGDTDDNVVYTLFCVCVIIAHKILLGFLRD